MSAPRIGPFANPMRGFPSSEESLQALRGGLKGFPVPDPTGDPTIDTPRIQEQINAGLSERATGFRVALADGAYVTGAPGLVVPDNIQKSVWLDGQGKGGTPTSSQSTRIVRTTTDPIFAAKGIGTAPVQQVTAPMLTNMTLDGNNLAGRLLSLRQCSDAVLEHLRLRNCLDTALFAAQAWNWRIYDLVVNNSGDQAGDKAAVVFTDEGVGGSNTNTVSLMGSTFEGNLWHDILVDGSVASGPAAFVTMIGNKWERAVGYAVVWNRAQGCVIAAASLMHTNGANGLIKQVNGDSNIIIGNPFDIHSASTAQEAVRLEGGNETVIVGNTFFSHVGAGVPRAINIVGSGITTVEIGLNSYEGAWTNFVTDSRATPRGLSERKGHVQGFDGISTKIKNGAIVDGDFLKTPPDGTIAVDSTNNRIYVRIAGTWKSVVVA